MNWCHWLPWNWFKHETNETQVPVTRHAPTSPEDLSNDQGPATPTVDDGLHGNRWPLGTLSDRLWSTISSVVGWLQPWFGRAGTAGAYQATFDLPGIDPKDLSVEVRNRTVIITGERRRERQVSDRGAYRIERSLSRIRRLLPLPDDADTEHVEATYRHGVLTVMIPRLMVQQPASRTIAVKVG